jgi:nucleoside phosphorylase
MSPDPQPTLVRVFVDGDSFQYLARQKIGMNFDAKDICKLVSRFTDEPFEVDYYLEVRDKKGEILARDLEGGGLRVRVTDHRDPSVAAYRVKSEEALVREASAILPTLKHVILVCGGLDGLGLFLGLLAAARNMGCRTTLMSFSSKMPKKLGLVADLFVNVESAWTGQRKVRSMKGEEQGTRPYGEDTVIATSKSQPEKLRTIPERCDVCLFASVEDEFKAIHRIFERLSHSKFMPGFTRLGREVFFGAMQNQSGESLTVQISCLPEMGGSNAVIHIHPILQEFLPRFTGMTGICAGDREKVALGDLVVAVRAYEYDAGKFVISDGEPVLHPDVKTFSPNNNIIGYVNGFSDWKAEVGKLRRPSSKRQQREWLLSALKLPGTRFSELDQEILVENMPQCQSITSEMEKGEKPLMKADGTLTQRAHRLMRAPWTPYKDKPEAQRFAMVMGSGRAVRSDNPFPSLRGPERKLIAVDMEGASLYQAVDDIRSLGSSALVVKGVSDYGDPDKDDTYHEYASEASAIYIFHFIQRYVNQLLMRRLT